MTRRTRISFMLAAASVCFAMTQADAAQPSQVQRLQTALDEARAGTGTPGVSAAIVVDGRIAWIGQSGTSDVRTGHRVDAGTMFSLASVTKMFVAAMVMRLSEKGDLALDGPIAPYVPSYVPDRSRVTVRELLGHTSGFPDDEDFPAIVRLLANPNYEWSRDDITRREGPVQFKPGSRFSYCNSCYVMLGSVIERAGSAPVGDQFVRLIALPLDLTGAVDFDRLPAYAPRISHGYDVQKKRLVDTFEDAKQLGVPTSIWGPVWTDGGVVATAAGVARFTDALFRGNVVSLGSLAQVLDPGPDHPHDVVLEKWRYDGHAWRGHSGYYYGFTAESWYDASRRLTITVLANRTDSGDPATAIWNRLTTAYDRLP